MGFFKKPEYPIDTNLPIILKGYIEAPFVRYEALGGLEMFKPCPEGRVKLNNVHPFLENGKWWAVSTIQKYSKRGWLKTYPDCFYWWKMWKLQDFTQNLDGGTSWKSGTEKGIYFRKPNSWRFDPMGTLRDGQLRHFVWTKGYLGLRYD